MLSNIKTRIYKYADLSHQALVQVKKWLQPGFDVNAFSNPTLKVACATNAVGQEISYCTIEPAFVVGSMATNPLATESEKCWAGAAIEDEIAYQASEAGVSKILMVLPKATPRMSGEKWVRIVEHNITPQINTHVSGCFIPLQHSN